MSKEHTLLSAFTALLIGGCASPPQSASEGNSAARASTAPVSPASATPNTPLSTAPSGESPSKSTSPAPSPQGDATPKAAGGEPDAQAIFAAFRAGNGYTKVNTAPIKSVHGGSFDYYVNSAQADQYKSVGMSAPDGMTVIKKGVESPDKLYLMQKVKGYDPTNNDWFYANSTSVGQASNVGKPQLCISCHQGYKATDYLGAPSIEEAKALLK
jgi:hypothetical protein